MYVISWFERIGRLRRLKTVSIIVVRMKDISSVFKVSGNEWLLYLLIGSALAYI